MIAKLIAKLLGAPVEQVAAYFTKKMELKQELKLAKLQGQISNERARAEMATRRMEMDHEWEGMQIQNSGWKDEYVLILLSIPLVLCFVPGTVGYVTAGFAALSTTPMWYQLLVSSVFFAVYGIRYWRRKDDA
jgi:hypothetical protein